MAVSGIVRSVEKHTKLSAAEYDGEARPGELVVDLTTYQLYVGNADGNLNVVGGGSGSPGGLNTQIQYNSTGTFAGSAGLTYNDVTNRLTVANLAVSGSVTTSLLPSANLVYDLGSPTRRWKDIYLSNNSIFLGDSKISSNATAVIIAPPSTANVLVVTDIGANLLGNMAISGNMEIAGSITATSITINGGLANGTSSVTIPVINGSVFTTVADVQILAVDSTGLGVAGGITVTGTSNLNAVSNITITGGTFGQVLTTDGAGVLSWSTSAGGIQSLIANGTSRVDIATANGNVVTTSGIYAWTFGTDGALTTPNVQIGTELGQLGDIGENMQIIGTRRIIAPNTNGFPAAANVANAVPTLIYTATNSDIWSFKMTTRLSIANETEMAEIFAATNSTGDIVHTVTNRLKTNPAQTDTVFDVQLVNLGSGDCMAVYATTNITSGSQSYITYDVVEFNRTQ
jgi:hypothetical protein